MAFENGSNMFAYSQDMFRNYRNDKFIFMKALQTVQYFETRPDYPYSIKELDKAILSILGQSLTDISYGIYKHIDLEHPLKEWNIRDESLLYEGDASLIDGMGEDETNVMVDSFKNELTSFCYTLSPVFDKIFLMEDSPMKLSRLTISELLPSKESVMRLIRNDGETLDLMIDDNDIDFIITTLTEKKDE